MVARDCAFFIDELLNGSELANSNTIPKNPVDLGQDTTMPAFLIRLIVLPHQGQDDPPNKSDWAMTEAGSMFVRYSRHT
jgi:hypothetical protein